MQVFLLTHFELKHLLWRTEMGLLKVKYMKERNQGWWLFCPVENSPSCIISAPINILIGFSCCIGKFHSSNSVCFICNSFPPFFYAWSFFMYKHDTQFTKTFGNCLSESNGCKTCIMQKLKAILNFALLTIIFNAACICVSHRQPARYSRQM